MPPSASKLRNQKLEIEMPPGAAPIGTVINLRPTTSRRCAAVLRRARIQGA